MFWSPKCLWPGPRYLFGFKHAAFVAAKRNLDKAQSEPRKGGGGHDIGVVLSPATRNKVIQSWLERDLAHFGNTVLFNFSVVTAVVVIIISCLWWVARGLRQPKNKPQVPLGKPVRSKWEPGFERRSFYTGSHNQLYRQLQSVQSQEDSEASFHSIVCTYICTQLAWKTLHNFYPVVAAHFTNTKLTRPAGNLDALTRPLRACSIVVICAFLMQCAPIFSKLSKTWQQIKFFLAFFSIKLRVHDLLIIQEQSNGLHAECWMKHNLQQCETLFGHVYMHDPIISLRAARQKLIAHLWVWTGD